MDGEQYKFWVQQRKLDCYSSTKIFVEKRKTKTDFVDGTRNRMTDGRSVGKEKNERHHKILDHSSEDREEFGCCRRRKCVVLANQP